MNNLAQVALSLVVAGIVAVLSFLYVLSPLPRPALASEQCYRDYTHVGESSSLPTTKDKKKRDNNPSKKQQQQWPSLPKITKDSADRMLSIVVPAYNEQDRLPKMLQETLSYLKEMEASTKDPLQGRHGKFRYEILIVDDCSKDKTVEVALTMAKEVQNLDIRVLSFEKNRGKGGAVMQGMQYVRGDYILMVDADGATDFSDLSKVLKSLQQGQRDGYGVAIGSRAHLVKTDAVVKRSFIRNILMHSFHKLVYLFGIRGIDDTQCGFKLFTRSAAKAIFPYMHVEGWVFDIEVLLVAQQLKIPILEVPVGWEEIDGSKVSLMRDSIKMAMDLVMIRLNYFLGIWTVPQLETPISTKEK